VGSTILGIDYGRVRVGVAYANAGTAAPQRLTTLANDDQLIDQLKAIISQHDVGTIVVGLPRGADGEDSHQTTLTRSFARTLAAATMVPIELQDEFASSSLASERLASQKLSLRDQRAIIDQEAAVIILEDHLAG
jgi:putative Holliday junction resolvase